jgi:hypothetical protein
LANFGKEHVKELQKQRDAIGVQQDTGYFPSDPNELA